jgi:hypothetical protein
VGAEIENGFVQQGCRRRRDEHLSAVRERGDASGPMDVDAHVSLGRQRRRARVQTHAHANRPGREILDAGLRGVRCTRSRREDDEEGIALRVHLHAAVGGEGVAQHPAMFGQRVGIRVWPDRVEQARRPLDVREEERDGAGREIQPHGWVCLL